MVDVSAERRTADHLKEMVKDVIRNVQGEWGLEVVAMTSDASGESRAAQKWLVQEFPWLAAPDCYAHQVSGLFHAHFFPIKLPQINLVVGDYFKVSEAKVFVSCTKQATELLKVM